MKIKCMKDELLEGINIVQKAVSVKASMPIMEGILVEAIGRLKLTGNDLEIGIEAYIDADIKEPGSVVLNAKMFGSIINKLPNEEITIEVKSDLMVHIMCGTCKFEIKGLAPQQFPALPQVKEDKSFEVDQKVIKDMIKQTSFAASTDDSRPILTGILVECKDGELTFVAIDGFRMAIRKRLLKKDVTLRAVVPSKTLNEIGKILTGNGTVKISLEKSQIMFEMAACKVVSRLLEGEYINYSSIIQNGCQTYVTVSTKDLLSSIERASLISGMEDKRIPVTFNIQDDKIVITSKTTNGAAREEVKAKIDGNNLETNFNPKYFIDALKAADDEKVSIQLTTNIAPCTINPLEGEEYVYLVLPVRVQS